MRNKLKNVKRRNSDFSYRECVSHSPLSLILATDAAGKMQIARMLCAK
jgi:hypothetical protein